MKERIVYDTRVDWQNVNESGCGMVCDTCRGYSWTKRAAITKAKQTLRAYLNQGVIDRNGIAQVDDLESHMRLRGKIFYVTIIEYKVDNRYVSSRVTLKNIDHIVLNWNDEVAAVYLEDGKFVVHEYTLHVK